MLRFLADNHIPGDLVDEAELWRRYSSYVRDPANCFGIDVQNLIFNVNFHDGEPIAVHLNENNKIAAVFLLIKKNDGGSEVIKITYRGAILSKKNIWLGQRCFNDRRYYVVESEFYCDAEASVGNGKFIHTISMGIYGEIDGEFEIFFDSLEWMALSQAQADEQIGYMQSGWQQFYQ